MTPGMPPVMPGFNPMTPGMPPMMPGFNPMMPGFNPMMPGFNPMMPGFNPMTPGMPSMVPGFNPMMPGFGTTHNIPKSIRFRFCAIWGVFIIVVFHATAIPKFEFAANAIVPAECMECNFCSDNVKFDQLCFCDHLMTERIFGSGSSSNQQRDSHAFCIECLKYYTKVDNETVPFATGCIGLKCLVENCENPIPWHEIRHRMPDRIESIRALEKQCDDLCAAISASLCLGRDHSVVGSSSNSVEKNHEESAKMKNKAINKKISSPKLMNILKGKSKEKVADECVECPICYELVMIDKLCFCHHLMGEAIFGCGSNNAQKVKESHAFCRECLKCYIKAALETKPFASGWIGLKCMAEKCENPIPWQEIKKHASLDELKAIETLESQCAELCVSAASLCLERCPKCNYAR